jgi:hypothetical protein
MRTVFVRMTPEILTLYPASVSDEIGGSAGAVTRPDAGADALISTAQRRF